MVETLFAMLLIVLAVLMLAGAIVAAARVNKSAKDLNMAFDTAKVQEVSDVKVTVDRSSGEDCDTTVRAYQTNDKNQYSYYTVPSHAEGTP